LEVKNVTGIKPTISTNSHKNHLLLALELLEKVKLFSIEFDFHIFLLRNFII